jgi:hypothetical protein
MMFKGTHVVGTTNWEEDAKILKEMDDVRARIRADEVSLIQRERRGEIPDAKDAKYRWQSSPYAWPVVGWPSDLEAITREDAEADKDRKGQSGSANPASRSPDVGLPGC